MKVNSVNQLKTAVKNHESVIEYPCGKSMLILFSAASVCLSLGITSATGVIASSGIIALSAAPATGGVSTVVIIAGAATIIAIVAILEGTNYELEIDWKNGTVRLILKNEK